jgi:hypothetical protein
MFQGNLIFFQYVRMTPILYHVLDIHNVVDSPSAFENMSSHSKV